jgi:hypothetical protein
MRFAIRGSILLVSSVLVSCGGSGNGAPLADAGTPGEGGGNLTPEQACGEAATSLCTKVSTCAPFLLTLLFGDMTTCLDSYTHGCLASANAPSSGATPASFQRCGADYAQGTCADLFSHNPPASCRASGGSVPNGGACGDDWQCTSGHCSVPANATCGVCGDRLGAGRQCRVEDDCDFGLRCTDGACVAQGAAGATCDVGHPCSFDNTCRLADGGTTGTCGPFSGAGQPCTALEDCGLAQGLVCNPQTKVCQMATSAQAGEQCGFVGGTIVFCAGSGGRCTTPPGGITGTCPALVTPGGACSTTMPCKAGATCVNALCTSPDPSTCR